MDNFRNKKDQEYVRRAKAVIPGTMYGHMSVQRRMPSGYPQFFERAEDCRLWDVDGNEYIDFMSAYGPMILGYQHPVVEEAARRQSSKLETASGPAPVMVEKDTGFQGYEPEGVTTLQPKKKPKGGELTPQEKEANRRISRVRVRVEHSIAGVKVFRVTRDVYRNLRTDFEDMVMETACGLHNLRGDFPIKAWLKAACTTKQKRKNSAPTHALICDKV